MFQIICCNNLVIYICIYTYLFIFIYIYILYIYGIIHLLQVKITETSERGTLLVGKHVHQMNELQLHLHPFFQKKMKNNNWTPDLTLDWCRAPYMSCVSNIYISHVVLSFQGANRSKRRCISLGSSSIELAVVSEPWWSLLSPKDRVVVVPLPNGRIACLIIKWDDFPSTTSKNPTCRTPSSRMLGVFWDFSGAGTY